MGKIAAQLRALALLLGAPGLFLVAFLDSSFLSLPELADLLVVWMVTRHKSQLLLYVAAATLGSLAGCLALYYVGRKGGEALMRKRFKGATVDKTLARFQRHGITAVLVPSMLPPPMPFKPFVLLAGAAGITPTQFSIAVVMGRGARYLALGILAVEYGDQTMTYLAEHGVAVSLAAAGVIIAGFGAYLAWTKARAAKRR
jgi:membrane protein YqaA with SNARE-associated domain